MSSDIRGVYTGSFQCALCEYKARSLCESWGSYARKIVHNFINPGECKLIEYHCTQASFNCFTIHHYQILDIKITRRQYLKALFDVLNSWIQCEFVQFIL